MVKGGSFRKKGNVTIQKEYYYRHECLDVLGCSPDGWRHLDLCLHIISLS